MYFRHYLGTALMGLFCYVAVPYEYCYSLTNKVESESEINLYFTKNDFFLDCSVRNNIFLQTSKDIVVHINGTETRHRNEVLCLKD